MIAAAREQLVGRERELAQLREVLDWNHAALVLVVGKPGIGKSALLHHFAGEAAARGWDDLGEALPVLHATTPDALTQRMHELMGLAAAPETEPAATGGVAPAAQEPVDAAAPSPSWKGAVQSVRTAIEGLPTLLPGRLSRSAEQVVAALADRAPVLLVLELHRPGKQLCRWLTSAFVPGLRRAGAAVMVIATLESVTDQAGLESAADRTVRLEALDAWSVRVALIEAAGPLPESELTAYVEAARQEPQLLRSLLRALSLLAPADGSSPVAGSQAHA